MQIPIRDLKQELKSNSDECKNVLSYDHTIISKSVFWVILKIDK